MNKITEQLLHYFRNSEKFRLKKYAPQATSSLKQDNLVGYLNLIRPFLIHIVGKYEANYIKKLSSTDQQALVQQLISAKAFCIIFENGISIPKIFYNQNQINLAISEYQNEHLFNVLTRELTDLVSNKVTLHGSFVVVFGQGILITGDSGIGKSSLLLRMIERGHMWVADDAPEFYLNIEQQVIGRCGSATLSDYIHVKEIGPINISNSYGKACKIKTHPLAAVIHLSNNSVKQNKKISAYTQCDSYKIMNKNIPMWHLNSTNPNLDILVENCAKNLILNNWDYNASNGLENALYNALSDPSTEYS